MSFNKSFMGHEKCAFLSALGGKVSAGRETNNGTRGQRRIPSRINFVFSIGLEE